MFVMEYIHTLQISQPKTYRTIILPVVLYGCETWSLTLREERRLKVFEGRVLRRIFGPKWDVGVWAGSRWLRIETGGGHL
jgi:hypothetical protein